jgi:hypothetical protein
LCTGDMETCEERAEEFEILQAPNIFLYYCLSTVVENAMVRYDQLPEWQQKSLTWLLTPIQLKACQTRRN